MTPGSDKGRITRDTAISIGFAVAVTTLGASGSWAIATKLGDMDQQSALRFQRIELKLEEMDLSARAGIVDRWSTKHMEAWVALLQARNPTLMIPQPKEIR